jgi:predicted permease
MIGNADDAVSAHSTVAVLSHNLWRTTFAADADILGRQVELNRVPFTIIGIAPPGFDGPFVGSPTGLYVPIASYPQLSHTPFDEWRTSHGWNWLHILARLAPGVLPEQADQAVKAIWPRVHSGRDAERQVFLADGSGGISHLRRELSQPLKVLLGATALILLLTCANLANLLFARMTARASESALRLSLGASRMRLLAGYLLETLLLSAAGTVLGWLISLWAVEAFAAFRSYPGNPVHFNIGVNARTIVFSAAACLLTSLLFGLIPALRAVRENPAMLLQGHARTVGDRSGWLGRALVGVQVAISACLLIGASLLAQSLFRLASQSSGFRPEGVLHVELNLVEAGYKTSGIIDFYRNLDERINGLPGVEATGVVWKHPVAGGGWTSRYRYSSGPAELDRTVSTHVNVVGPGLFGAIGTRILDGRDIAWTDAAPRPPVAIVNQAFAQKHWPHASAVGQWIQLEGSDARCEIVGVVESFRYQSFHQPAPPTVFLPFQQMGDNILGLPLSMEVRSPSGGQLAPAIRRVIEELDPRLPADIELLTTRLERRIGRERLLARLSAALAALAFLVTVIGIYGVAAFRLRRRTKELGLRMALGATPQALVTETLGDALRMLAIGLPAGLALAFLTSRFLASLLFGIREHDPATYAAIALLITATTLAATWLPARRIIGSDPASSLRYE